MLNEIKLTLFKVGEISSFPSLRNFSSSLHCFNQGVKEFLLDRTSDCQQQQQLPSKRQSYNGNLFLFQEDIDGNGIGNACENDEDGDSTPDLHVGYFFTLDTNF